MVLLAALKSPLLWRFIGIAAVLAAIVSTLHYTYQLGHDHGTARTQLTYETALNADNATNVERLLTAQGRSLAVLVDEQERALKARDMERKWQIDLISGLGALKNVNETDCTRVANDTWRLLNSAACEYNRQRGFTGSDPDRAKCMGEDATR